MDKKCPNLYQRARLSTGMSQERAAELLGLSVESLKQYEGGKTVPKDETVAKMVEVYSCPWLAYEHSQATDRLGVLPEIEPKPLVMSSVALENRMGDLMERLRTLMRIAEDDRVDESEKVEADKISAALWDAAGAIFQAIYAIEEAKDIKKERPDTGMSKRSKGCGLVKSTSVYLDYNTDPHRVARPSFPRRGGASL